MNIIPLQSTNASAKVQNTYRVNLLNEDMKLNYLFIFSSTSMWFQS